MESTFSIESDLISKPIVIFGSSRKDGETWKAVTSVFKSPDEIVSINLNELKLSYFDYDQENIDDHFLGVVEQMLNHKTIILATPVYWYSMSAIMKAFLDRWADLLISRKDLGRALKDRNLSVITSYANDASGFETPFELTSKYLGMQYGGCFYYYSGGDLSIKAKNEDNANDFRRKILG